ncbi:hypothetical protein BH11PLA2_BH11PLA2_16340 [soil metagenome]
MSISTIPRSLFDWKGFSKSITSFAVTHGLEEAFPVVDDGRVVSWQDHRDELLEDRDDLEGIPDSPLERLVVKFDLFAQFTVFEGSNQLACADGTVIEVPDFDGDVTDISEHHRMIEKTVCDECHAYGFVISLKGKNLVFQTVLFSDRDGDCFVHNEVEPGLVEVPMVKFIQKFITKRGASVTPRPSIASGPRLRTAH